MRALAISVLLLVTACGDDGESSNGGVAGLWAWCDDDACAALDDGGLFFSGGRVLDAYYDAAASTYCTYEEVGTYSVEGTTVVITPAGDAGADDEETYTLDGSFLRGENGLKRVQATAAAPASCPN